MNRLLAIAIAATALASPALAEPRLPDIPPAARDADQTKAAQDYQAARGVPLAAGPFMAMMYSPQAMIAARQAGDYFRYKTSLGPAISEFVITVTARFWNADYEWSAHVPTAAKSGMSPAIMEAIRTGKRPDGLSDDQAIAYDFATELLRDKAVSDATFDRAVKRFGKAGVVEMTGIVGYYSLIAMELSVAQTPPLPGVAKLPRLP